MISVTIGVFALGLISCEKEEQPVEKKYVPGDQTIASVYLQSGYKYQVFYDLESNAEITQNLKTSWDLGFECGPGGYHVKLNSSKKMKVWSSGETNFSALESNSGAKWSWDNPNGSMDSTAIGEWAERNGGDFVSNNEVLVLDLGLDLEGDPIGYKKIQILGLENNQYTVKVADLSGENEFIKTIPKDDDYNFMFLSIGNQGEIVTVEPPKDDWDLVFTRYTHTFYDENNNPLPYVVTGILINSYSTSVHQDTIFGFNNVNLEIVEDFEYLYNHNTIGYDWKTYDYDARGYIMHPEKNYLIKNRVGNYFKFHVIDFYNESAQPGNIKFEFQKLLP